MPGTALYRYMLHRSSSDSSAAYTTVYITPPGPIFHVVDISALGILVAGVANVSPRALRRRIVWYWQPLRCRAIALGKPPPVGCDAHRPRQYCWYCYCDTTYQVYRYKAVPGAPNGFPIRLTRVFKAYLLLR